MPGIHPRPIKSKGSQGGRGQVFSMGSIFLRSSHDFSLLQLRITALILKILYKQVYMCMCEYMLKYITTEKQVSAQDPHPQ